MLSHSNGHICPEKDIYIDDVDTDIDVGFNYDDDDVLSDVDYDSDAIEETLSYRQQNLENQLHSSSNNQKTAKAKSYRYSEEEDENRRRTIFFEEDEKEFSDDEYYDSDDNEEDQEEIDHAIYIKLQNKKYASMLETLSVLDGKLNWLEKIPNCSFHSFVNNEDYPKIKQTRSFIKIPKKRITTTSNIPTKIRYYPAKHIAIKIGNKTFIGFKEHIKEEKKLCNAIKDGKECQFGDKCKFSHKIPKKPNCKYGVKCANKKCTFIHPESPVLEQQQILSVSPKTEHYKKSIVRSPNIITTTSYDDDTSFRKIWLCKNIFKFSTTGEKFLYDSIKIEKTGNCRFGDHCVYAHSSEEIKQNLEECKFKEECKSIKITQIKKDDKKVRRYENNPETRKCCRIHPKERFIDFIKRIQLNTTLQMPTTTISNSTKSPQTPSVSGLPLKKKTQDSTKQQNSSKNLMVK